MDFYFEQYLLFQNAYKFSVLVTILHKTYTYTCLNKTKARVAEIFLNKQVKLKDLKIRQSLQF